MSVDQAEKIKQTAMELFDTGNIFNNSTTHVIERYHDFFSQENIQNILNNQDIVQSAKILFENSLNISEASKMGYMHRNTLIYRIEKIKKMIGLDIRVFKEAIVFVNMLLIYNSFQV